MTRFNRGLDHFDKIGCELWDTIKEYLELFGIQVEDADEQQI